MRPHRRIRSFLLAGLLALALAPSPSRAATIVLPLPELIGEYPQPRVLSVQIDLGTSFVSIDEVRLHVAGTVIQGLVGKTSPPFDARSPGSAFGAQLEAQLYFLERPTAYTGGDGPFEAERRFFDLRSGSVDSSFLLDGETRLHSAFVTGLLEDEDAISKPSGSVSDASLVVDGVLVPEPTTLEPLGLGITGLAALARRLA